MLTKLFFKPVQKLFYKSSYILIPITKISDINCVTYSKNNQILPMYNLCKFNLSTVKNNNINK
jgi:hypothetical protein